MIIRDPPKPWQLLFILRGSIIPFILPQLALVIAISSLVTLLHASGIMRFPSISPLPFSLIGIALSIFSGFRNSASYERWWEARKILGQMIVECRSLSRASIAYLPKDSATRIVPLIIAFAVVLRRQLRGDDVDNDLKRYLAMAGVAALPANANTADAILSLVALEISAALKAGHIAPPLAQMMEERLVGLSGVLVGTERFITTPLPYGYSLLLHRTAYMFCLLLPFGLADAAGYWTPLLCGIVAYTFFGLDALGDELAAPFGKGDNALSLSALVRVIEINLLQQLGHTTLPPPVTAEGFILN